MSKVLQKEHELVIKLIYGHTAFSLVIWEYMLKHCIKERYTAFLPSSQLILEM